MRTDRFRPQRLRCEGTLARASDFVSLIVAKLVSDIRRTNTIPRLSAFEQTFGRQILESRVLPGPWAVQLHLISFGVFYAIFSRGILE
jgi:hypothetical protein